MKTPASTARPALLADQMHFDAVMFAIVDRAMGDAPISKLPSSRLMRFRTLRLKRAVTPAASLRHRIKYALILFEVDADHHLRVPSRMSRALRRKPQASCGSKFPSVEPGKINLGHCLIASGKANGAVKSAVTG